MFNTDKPQDIERVYTTPWISLDKRTVYRKNGDTFDFYVQQCSDDVFVFGVTQDDQALLLNEYYPAVHKHVKTIISGAIDDKNPVKTAELELLEEAGCEAKEMIFLGSASRGKYTVGKSYFFLAKDIKKVTEQTLESGEDIEVSFISKQKMVELVQTDKLESVFELLCAKKALEYLGWK